MESTSIYPAVSSDSNGSPPSVEAEKDAIRRTPSEIFRNENCSMQKRNLEDLVWTDLPISDGADVIRKVLLIGDPAVGKTSLRFRYVNGSFRTDYKVTQGVDFALKVVKWSDDISLKLQLWDIAGQERFTSMTRVYYRDAHACIIMFDLTQRNTFQNALKWKKDLDSKCRQADGAPLPCILLANKCDLPTREVEQSEIETFCKENDFIGWTETSVKDNLMVDEAMKFLLDEIMARYGRPDDISEEYDLPGKVLLSQSKSNKPENKKCSC